MFDLFGAVSPGMDRVAGAAGSVELATISSIPERPRGLVVFLHGLTGSKEDFMLVVPQVAELGYAAMAYDHRGSYESEHVAPYTIDAFAADAAALIDLWRDRLGPAIDVHVVGHSFGGLIGLALAAQQPQRLASLTMLCSGPAGMGDQERLRVLNELLGSGMDLSEIFRRKLEIDGDDFPEFMVNFLRDRFVRSDRQALIDATTAVMHTPELLTPVIGQLPVFVMYGENDGSWPQPVQNEMARRVGVTPQVIPDAMHSPALENVDDTARLIVENADSVRRPL